MFTRIVHAFIPRERRERVAEILQSDAIFRAFAVFVKRRKVSSKHYQHPQNFTFPSAFDGSFVSHPSPLLTSFAQKNSKANPVPRRRRVRLTSSFPLSRFGVKTVPRITNLENPSIARSSRL